MKPKKLYKYLPKKYLKSFVKNGNLLFRSLSYFQKVEDVSRGDFYEGMHVDHPDNDITIHIPNKTTMKGDFAFINKIKSDNGISE